MAEGVIARRQFRDKVRERLVALREGHAWSQSQVARLVGVGKERYAKWENRVESELPFYFAWRIAALYSVPLESLTGPSPHFAQNESTQSSRKSRKRPIRRPRLASNRAS